MAITDPMKHNIDTLLDENKKLKSKIRRKHVVLKAVEWIKCNDRIFCPYCNARPSDRHESWCTLNLEIKDI